MKFSVFIVWLCVLNIALSNLVAKRVVTSKGGEDPLEVFKPLGKVAGVVACGIFEALIPSPLEMLFLLIIAPPAFLFLEIKELVTSFAKKVGKAANKLAVKCDHFLKGKKLF